MMKICPGCNRTMFYDSYFGSYICRQCGKDVAVYYTDQKKRTRLTNANCNVKKLMFAR